MEIRILGSGDAYGIPRPGCGCPQCAEARADRSLARLRSGVLIKTATEVVLLDCSPDVARALDREGLSVDDVTRVMISHKHNDHCYGLRDLAGPRTWDGTPLRVHANASTAETIQAAFGSLLGGDNPRIELMPWGAGVRVELGGAAVTGFETHHWEGMETTAFLIEVDRAGAAGEQDPYRIAYATDMGSELPSPREIVEGVDLFVGDGTYLGRAGYGHPGTTRMIEIAEAVGAKQIAITHVGHWGKAGAEACALVPEHVEICLDRGVILSR